MHISSATSGAASRPGLYPALVPASRRDATDTVANAADKRALSVTSEARSLQQVAPPVAENGDASRALVLARQREGSIGLAGSVESGGVGDAAAAQRAVAQYAAVASTEQRFELTEVLAGIDVFA
jgi:hypothetical protein